MLSDRPLLHQEVVRRARTIGRWLAEGEFSAVENYTEGRRFSASELSDVVERLGEPLAVAPDGMWDDLDVREEDAAHPTFVVLAPLWVPEGYLGVGAELRVVLIDGLYAELELQGFPPLDEATLALCERFRGALDRPRPLKVLTRRGPGPVSETPVPERWRATLSALIHRLVIGDYAGLARDGFVAFADDPDDGSIGEYIERYPATLVDLPDEAWAYSEHAPLVDAEQTWWVIVPLWTAEEGPSDLSLEATIVDDGHTFTVQLDGAHVM